MLAAGYPRFFGMAGSHTFFHTPADSAATTGPEILEPIVRAFAETLDDAAREDPSSGEGVAGRGNSPLPGAFSG